MSGIAVVLHRDGTPVAGEDLELMTVAMADRAVDGVRQVIDGPVGVGFCSTATAPTSGSHPQPLRCRGGSAIVAMDGRLDDRRSLVARLGRGADPRASDPELLVHAVERWGAGFVNHLIGDFAIVMATAARRQVLCVRDHLGVKPLYYASVGALFVAASDVKGVLAHPGVPDDLDPAAFATWAEQWVVPEGTIYRRVVPVPMGSTVIATPNGLGRPARYWSPSCEPRRWRAPADLVEEYRWLQTEATRDRLRSTGPVAVAMSGGLDSTAVASTALALARGEPGVPEVRIASLVFPGHARADESDLITTMERSLGSPVRRIRPRPRTPDDLAGEVARYRDLPDVPNDQLGALVRPELGERVLLTGLGGDDWFYNSIGLDVSRAMRHGRWLTAQRAARQGVADGRHRTTAGALWRFGLRPLPKVPGALVARSPTMARLITSLGGALGARFLEASWCPSGVPLDTAWVFAASRNPLLAARLAVIERRAAHHGFEYRHPLHDVRLVELSLQLPGRLRILGGDARWLPRQAMVGSLPAPVRLRTAKAEFSVNVREELDLADASGVLVRAMAAADDPGRLARSWLEIQVLHADRWHPGLTGLWSALAAQVWRGSTGRPHRREPRHIC